MKTIAALLVFLSFLSACRKNNPDPTLPTTLRTEGALVIDNKVRTYLINLPPGYDEGPSFPLVIFMHGGGGSANQAETSYKFTDKANAEQFAVVYPEGVQSDGLLKARTWNAGTCCEYAVEQNINDVKYLSTLIDTLLKRYPKLNAKRVYATGMSNGAMMSYRLACELSGKIAAIAPVAGTLVLNECVPTRTGMPILHIHSILDDKVPVEGGRSTFGFVVNSVEDGLKKFVGFNMCSTTPQLVLENELLIHKKWTNCKNEVVIEYYLTKDGGHSWPGGTKPLGTAGDISKAINANEVIWDFFKKYELK